MVSSTCVSAQPCSGLADTRRMPDLAEPEPVKRPPDDTLSKPGGEPVTQPVPPGATPAHKPFKLGNKLGDEGAVCERSAVPSHAACFMNERQRAVTIAELREYNTKALGSYQMALEHARVEALLHKQQGWGVIGELLFIAASTALILGTGFVAGTVATASAKTLLAAEQDALAIRAAVAGTSLAEETATATAELSKPAMEVVKAIVKQATGAVKPMIKAKFDHFPADVARKGEFITALQNDAGPWFTAIEQQVVETGDDAALLAARAAFHPDLLTMNFFQDQIAIVLARFDASRISDIGPRHQGPVRAGSTEVVQLHAYGQTRLAMIDFGERKTLGRSHGDTWETDGNSYFVHWIDDDLADAALAAQYQAFYHVRVIDVSRGHAFGRAQEIDAWVAERSRQTITKRVHLPFVSP